MYYSATLRILVYKLSGQKLQKPSLIILNY